jgi:hypothetical protein
MHQVSVAETFQDLAPVTNRFTAGSYPMDLGKAPLVIDVTFPMLPLGSNRAQQLNDNGSKDDSTQQTVQY